MEIIILAGGFGTRLKSVVEEQPKCLAPINGKPFLQYLFTILEKQGVAHVILALGYKHQMVIDWLKTKAFTFKVSWVIESTPLGTGGALKLALNKSRNKDIYLMNGDTLFDISLKDLNDFEAEKPSVNIALRKVKDSGRYGAVEISDSNEILKFSEKSPMMVSEGLINGGIYFLHNMKSIINNMPDIFSFEKDILTLSPDVQHDYQLMGKEYHAYFLDIGIPEDYQTAQTTFQNL